MGGIDELRKARRLELLPMLASILLPSTAVEEQVALTRRVEAELARNRLDLQSYNELVNTLESMEVKGYISRALEAKKEIFSSI